MTKYINPDGEQFFSQVASYLPLEDRQQVREAFELARREHGNDRRKSGELFFTHPLTVAYYLAEYFAEAPVLIAALLHDVAEDTSVSVQEIEELFGADVGRIVGGLTKFDRVTAKAKLGLVLSPDQLLQATHFRLLDTFRDDVRVGIVKIFDRLHNMRTIEAMPPHKQEEKARETLSIYAPLANRLGMWLIKNELQDISLNILDKERYGIVVETLKKRTEANEEDFRHIMQILRDTFSKSGVMVGEVMMAEEDVYRAYCAYIEGENGKLPQEFETPPAIVVLAKDVPSCYMALGHVHGIWRPVPGEFDDYIAAPRDNLYRSLHTTVKYNGRPVKIRFRTLNMQIESQTGILAKWMNSAGMEVWSQEASKRIDTMIDTISERIKQGEDAIGEGVRTVLEDVFTNQIIVYTPQGDMRELPQGATPIDFAYTIHTAVGNSCRAALVNGQQVPLTHQLQEGDSVKILRHGSEPQRTWLDEDLGYIKTSSARTALRRWFRRLPEEEAIEQGQKLLRAELYMLGLPSYSHLLVAGWFGFSKAEDLYHAIGRAEVLPSAVATKVLTDTWAQEPEEGTNNGQMAESAEGEWFIISNAGDRDLKMCKRCNPRPGDNILGFIRKNDQVTVHSIACPLIRQDEMHGGRSLKLRWGEEVRGRPVAMRIDVHDRDGLLSEIADLMSREHINITMLCSRTIRHRATLVLGVKVATPRQVVRVLHRIQAMVNVINVECLNLAPGQWADEEGSLKSFCPFDMLEGDFCGLHEAK